MSVSTLWPKVLTAGLLLPAMALAGEAIVGSATPARPAPPNATFRVHHALTVKDIPAGSKTVRIWFWLPDDDESQKVLDLTVSKAPAGYKITREADYGNRYLYVEVDHPEPGPVAIATDFLIRRDAVSVALDPEKAGPLTDAHRTLFAENLRRDVPGMEVDAPIVKLAGEICGNETNEVRQVRLLSDWVVNNTDHYSKPNAPKSSGKGSATYCLANKGGGCTDQHALFIALARRGASRRGSSSAPFCGPRTKAKTWTRVSLLGAVFCSELRLGGGRPVGGQHQPGRARILLQRAGRAPAAVHGGTRP